MQVDGMEGDDAQEVNTRHHHTRHPEEDDIVAGLHDRGRVITPQVGSNIRPSKRAERPQPGTEPGIQYILVLVNIAAIAVRTSCDICAADSHQERWQSSLL